MEVFTLFNILFIIGQEIGSNNFTPHLQGYIECPHKMRWSEFKLMKEIHWEPAKGNRESNIIYCSKEGQFKCSDALMPTLCISQLYPWQINIVDLCLNHPPDGRSVTWVMDKLGGKGKSAFCKYMFIKHKALVIQGGKLSDIMNIIFGADMGVARIVLIDIPRNNKNFVSYSAIECILNGMITNTKYETGIKVFNPPHVIVFSNFEPNYEKLSTDRWNVIDLCKLW